MNSNTTLSMPTHPPLPSPQTAVRRFFMAKLLLLASSLLLASAWPVSSQCCSTSNTVKMNWKATLTAYTTLVVWSEPRTPPQGPAFGYGNTFSNETASDKTIEGTIDVPVGAKVTLKANASGDWPGGQDTSYLGIDCPPDVGGGGGLEFKPAACGSGGGGVGAKWTASATCDEDYVEGLYITNWEYATLMIPGNGEGNLSVPGPGDSEPIQPGGMQAKQGSAYVRWNLGFSMGGRGDNSLILHEKDLVLTSFSPNALFYPISHQRRDPIPNDPLFAPLYRRVYDEDDYLIERVVDVLHGDSPVQLRSGQFVVDIQKLGAPGNAPGYGYELRFYPARFAVRSIDPEDQRYTFALGAKPMVVYRVENPDAGTETLDGGIAPVINNKLKITELRYDPGINPSREVEITEFTQNGSVWWLSTGKGELIKSRSTTVEGGNTRHTTEISNRAGELLSREVEVLAPNGLPVEQRRGIAGQETWDTYLYDGTRIVRHDRSDGYYEVHTYDAAAPEGSGWTVQSIATPADEYGPGVIRTSYEESSDSGYASHGESINGVNLWGSESNQETRSYAVNNDPPIELEYRDTVRTTGDATLLSASLSYTDSAGVFLAGRPFVEWSEDGTVTFYEYSRGNWEGVFDPDITGQSLRIVATHGLFAGGLPLNAEWDPSWYPSLSDGATREVTVRDAAGRTVSQQSSVYGLNGDTMTSSFIALPQVIHEFDDAGHLLSTRRECDSGLWRTTYTATWDRGRKMSETDETGIETTYSDWDTKGRPLLAERAGLPARPGLPAIPSRTTATLRDALGRSVGEVVTSAGALPRLSAWHYDAAGRMDWQAENGLVTWLSYSGGTTPTQRILPDGGTESSTYFASGVLKKTSGTTVVRTLYAYNLNGANTVETVTRGEAPETLVEQTVRDAAGRTVSETSGGVTRTFEYAGTSSNVVNERVAGTVVRSHTYDLLGRRTGTNVPVANNLIRTYTSDVTYWGEYRVEKNAINGVVQSETWEKIKDLALTELSSRGSRDVDGASAWTWTTRTLDSATHLVTDTTDFSAIGNRSETRGRAGLVQSVKSPTEAQAAVMTHDGLGRVLSARAPDGGVTTYIYDPVSGQLASMAGPGSSTEISYYLPYEAWAGREKSRVTDGSTQYFTYNSRGQIKHTWGSIYPVWYDYDAVGRLEKMHTYRTVSPTGEGQWPEGDVTDWDYQEGTGQLLRKRYAKITGLQRMGPVYEYDAFGRLATRSWARPNASNQLVKTTYSYNNAGELTAMAYNDGTPGVTIAYNAQGRPMTVTDGTGTHVYGYTPAGRTLSEQFTAKTTLPPLVNTSQTYGYANGQLESMVLSSGGTDWNWSSYGYDSATGRMKTVDYPGAGWQSRTATYGYEAGRNAWTTLQDGAVTTTRTFDTKNRLKSQWAAVNGANQAGVRYLFDEATNRRVSATHREGATQPEETWNYLYNERGEVTWGSHPKPGRNFAYGYDAIGNREWAQGNGQTSAYTANALNQVVQRTVPGVLEVRGSVAGGANGLGALIDGQPAPLSGRDFYRALSVENSAAAVWKAVEIWAWGDNDGQEVETHETRAGLVPKTPEVLQYDADGNLTKDGQWCYQWDAENRLVRMYRYMPQGWTSWPDFKIWELTFHYDWQGRRVLKRVNPGDRNTNQRSVQFAYDGWNVVAERETVSAEDGWSTATSTLRRYVWGADLSGTPQGAGGVGGLLAETFTDGDGEHTLLPAYDGNGNIVAMLDGAGGAVRAEYSYGPFGEPLRATGAMAKGNPFRFSTKYTDDETGLVYYGYRYHNPTTGRWLSRDPIQEKGGPNLYAFVENNSVNIFDLMGLCPVTKNAVPVSKYTPEGPLAVAPGWHLGGYQDPYESKWGGTITDKWDINLLFTKCDEHAGNGILYINKAENLGRYWWRHVGDLNGRPHEEKHVADKTMYFNRWYTIANGFTGKCKSEAYAQCYMRVNTAYGTAFRDIERYRAGKQHTGNDPDMKYGSGNYDGKGGGSAYAKALAILGELRSNALVSLGRALDAHRECSETHGGGGISSEAGSILDGVIGNP